MSILVDREGGETHKNEGSIEVLVVLLHVFRIALRCLSVVYGVEVEMRVFVLDWLKVHPQGLLMLFGVSLMITIDPGFLGTHHRGSISTGLSALTGSPLSLLLMVIRPGRSGERGIDEGDDTPFHHDLNI